MGRVFVYHPPSAQLLTLLHKMNDCIGWLYRIDRHWLSFRKYGFFVNTYSKEADGPFVHLSTTQSALFGEATLLYTNNVEISAHCFRFRTYLPVIWFISVLNTD
jgi:hypothetical protein